MKRVSFAVSAALLAAYPFLVYWGLHLAPRLLAFGLVILVLPRLVAPRGRREFALLAALPSSSVLLGSSSGLLLGDGRLLLYTPCMISASLLTVFALSLVRPPSMIERFARLRVPDLPNRAVGYCRTVTLVWCGFFLLNGAVSLWTALDQPLSRWLVYNGVVSYLLIAALLLGDLAFHHSRVRAFRGRRVEDSRPSGSPDVRPERIADGR